MHETKQTHKYQIHIALSILCYIPVHQIEFPDETDDDLHKQFSLYGCQWCKWIFGLFSSVFSHIIYIPFHQPFYLSLSPLYQQPSSLSLYFGLISIQFGWVWWRATSSVVGRIDFGCCVISANSAKLKSELEYLFSVDKSYDDNVTTRTFLIQMSKWNIIIIQQQTNVVDVNVTTISAIARRCVFRNYLSYDRK